MERYIVLIAAGWILADIIKHYREDKMILAVGDVALGIGLIWVGMGMIR